LTLCPNPAAFIRKGAHIRGFTVILRAKGVSEVKTFVIFGMLVVGFGQTPSTGQWDWTLPSSFAVKESVPQTYRVTCDYYYLDTKGNLSRRERVSAQYTRDLPEGRVRWSDVTVAESAGSPDNFGPAKPRDFMEGFSYSRASLNDMLKPEFFRGFPPAAMLERNLVWDTHMVESFGQDHFSDLDLNVPFHVPQSAGLSLAGAGTFKLKDLQLIWTGISQRNGQECAVIDYRALLNTFDVKMPGVSLIAGSHFWGQVWVSLRTKRIEYATLYEDVLGELSLEGREKPQIVSILRIGVFEPVGK
jgi:hypothetical protein